MKIKTNKQKNKWDLIKLKSFCTTKKTTNKTKRQHSEWEKIFANETTVKGLLSKIWRPIFKQRSDMMRFSFFEKILLTTVWRMYWMGQDPC